MAGGNTSKNIFLNTSGARKSLKELAADARKARNELNLIGKDDPGYNKKAAQFRKLNREIRQTRQDLYGTKSAFDNLKHAAAPLVGVTAAFTAGRKAVDLFLESAQEFAGFEQALDDLQAITGAGAVDMQFYAEQAKEVGRTTTLSAQQAVQAYKLIGSAKPELLENAKALAEVSKEAIVLAEAAGQELPEATKALTTFLNQFNLGAEESSRTINVLAAGSKKGAGDIAFLTESVSKFGPNAAAMNISIEQSAAAMEVFAEKGLTAEKSGVSFRNILVELAKSSDDLNPEVVGLQTAIENLGKKQLSTSELADKFGKQNLAAAQILTESADRLKYFTEELTDTNIAYEQAAIRVDNLKGKWKQISSVSEALRISVGERLAPALNSVSDWVLSNLNSWNRLIKAPVENKLESIRSKLNAQLEVLKVANFNEEQRARAIREINEEYGEYLPHLIDEKASLQDISDIQEQSNKLLLQRILMMKFEEELKELMDLQASAAEQIFQTEKKIAENRLEMQEGGDYMGLGAKQTELLKGFSAANQSIIDNTGESITQLEEKYKAMAASLGVVFEGLLGSTLGSTGEGGDPNEETNPIAITRKNMDALTVTMDGLISQIKKMQEEAGAPDAMFDYKKWKEQQAEVQTELDLALMSDQEKRIYETEQYYDALLDKATAHGLEIAGLEQKKWDVINGIRQESSSEQLEQMGQFYDSLKDALSGAMTAFQGMEEGWLEDSKAFTMIQMLIDTASAMSSMIAAATKVGVTPVEKIAAMGTGIAAVFSYMGKAKKVLSQADKGSGSTARSYYYGGFTGSGSGLGYGDQHGEYQGYVHDNEYVVNQSALQVPWVANITRAIEAIPEKAGSAPGNTSTTAAVPVDNSGIESLLKVLIGVVAEDKQRPIAFPWRDVQELKENGLDRIDEMNSSRGL